MPSISKNRFHTEAQVCHPRLQGPAQVFVHYSFNTCIIAFFNCSILKMQSLVASDRFYEQLTAMGESSSQTIQVWAPVRVHMRIHSAIMMECFHCHPIRAKSMHTRNVPEANEDRMTSELEELSDCTVPSGMPPCSPRALHEHCEDCERLTKMCVLSKRQMPQC